MKCLCALCEEFFEHDFIAECQSHPEIQIIRCEADGFALLHAATMHRPQLVIADLLLKGVDGLMASEMLRLAGHTMPIYMLGAFCSDDLLNRFNHFGTFNFLQKPLSTKTLFAQIKKHIPSQNFQNLNIETVKSLLDDLGLSSNLKGYVQLQWAIAIAAKQQHFLEAPSRLLYPVVAQKTASTAVGVERNIRTAIEWLWNNQNPSTLYQLFGNTIPEDRGKPTNMAFIAWATDALLISKRA